MRINISKIPKEGLRLEEEADADSLELNTNDLKFDGPVKLEVEVRREGADIFISGDIKGKMSLTCGRCLDNYEQVLAKGIFLQLPAPHGPVLDITDNIREEIILEYPMKPLCKESCKGLCPKCGKNLNEGACSCN